MTNRSRRLTGLGVLLGLAAAWQILSMLVTWESVPGEPMMPGWQVLATDTVRDLADYWEGGFGVEAVSEGGSRTYAGAALAIVSNSVDTSLRLFAGLLLGSLAGTMAGLAVSWSRWTRRLVSLPGQVLRTFPLLALIPLFQLWFGLSFHGMVLFVALAVGVVFFTGTVNAVANIPPIYADYARTMGAGRAAVYRGVILPAMFPELRSSILLAVGVAWTAVIGAEFLGAQTGLGQIIVASKQFGYVDRMLLVGLILLTYAAATYLVVERVSRRLVEWMPRASAG